MDRPLRINLILRFLFGTVFIATGLSMYGVIGRGASLFAELGNPVFWMLGLLFGVVLAFDAWTKSRHRQ